MSQPLSYTCVYFRTILLQLIILQLWQKAVANREQNLVKDRRAGVTFAIAQGFPNADESLFDSLQSCRCPNWTKMKFTSI